MILRALAFSIGAAVLSAQAPQPSGVAPVWDIRSSLDEIAAHALRLLPVLDRIDAKAWIAQGASETYAAQLESCKVQAKALAQGAKDLARQPERISAALELFFRIHALDGMFVSLAEGIRKYQNPAMAEMLAGVAAENGAAREQFQRYLTDLAAQREQQWIVMDAEAQRCRGILARQPVQPAPSANSTRRKK